MRIPGLAVAAILMAVPSPAPAERGVYIEEEIVKSEVEGAPSRSLARTWLLPGKMRKEQAEAGSVTILREDRNAVWVLNTKERSWFELDRQMLDRLGEMGMSVLLQAKDEDPSKWLRKTGRERKVAGYDAYEVAAEDRPLPGTRISLWLAPGVPIDPALRRTMTGELFGASNPGAQLLRGLRELEGYPVELELRVRIGARVLEIRQTLRKVEALEIDAGQFEIPEGFTRGESPFAGLLGGSSAAK